MADERIRIYRLPPPAWLTRGFCHGGRNTISFLNVDWFDAVPPADSGMQPPTREQLIEFIRRKRYYDPTARFLVLDDRPGETFIMEPVA